MSLGQVKEIIRKPWGHAAYHEGSVSGGKQNQASVKSLQSACVSVRVPLQITIRNSSGTAEVYSAQTILLNQRGARIECTTPSGQRAPRQHPFKVDQMLWIEVPSTGKEAGGKVVWADTHPNRHGNFEFTVELDDSRDLFDGSFPANDSDEPKRMQHTLPSFGTEIDDSPEDLDAICYARLIPAREVDATPAELDPASETVESDPGRSSPALEICKGGSDFPPAEPAAAHSNTSPALDAVSASQRLRPNEAQDEFFPMTDRLADLFKQVIESAVQKEEAAASARLVKAVRDQVEQTQQAAFENLRQEMTQQASGMEDQLMQQCRSRTEQMLSTVTKNALHALSNDVDEMARRTEERIQEIFNNLVNQLEQRSANTLAETSSRIEEQAANSATGIHGAIVQKVLAELNEKQKDMMEQAEQRIGMATEQNLVKLRSGLMRALQELTGTNNNVKLAV